MTDTNPGAGPVSDSASRGVFATTHWSIVLAAGQKDSPHATAALEKLCRTYWYLLYAYVRRRGASPEDAQDLTQSFFARLLERDLLSRASPERGRFRSFLLTALQNFLADEHDRAIARKRGAGQPLISLDCCDIAGRDFWHRRSASTRAPSTQFCWSAGL